MVKEIRINLYSFLIKHNYKAPRTMNVMAFRKDLHSVVRGLTLSADERFALNGALGLYTDNQYKKLLDRLLKHGHMKD